MSNFLNEICGQRILKICSRGSAICCELFRLSENIPEFLSESHYSRVIFDFDFLQTPEKYEELLNSPFANEMDDEIQGNYLPTLERFYNIFENMVMYVKDLQSYWDDVQSGRYFGVKFEKILSSEVIGRQLICESLYLWGVMLLLLDQRISGKIREQMVVLCCRYKNQAMLGHFDDVCKLVRSTGYVHGEPSPPNYPDTFFQRFSMTQGTVDMIIEQFRSGGDIYNHKTRIYSLNEHRSFALGKQSPLLFVILYFSPHTLQNEFVAMQEIVLHHFSDNWVLPVYMGVLVDLSTKWDRYKAAKQALAQTIKMNKVNVSAQSFGKRVHLYRKEVMQLLREGELSTERTLQNTDLLLDLVRNCNTTLKWLLLHNQAERKKLQTAVANSCSRSDLVSFLMETSQMEFKLKTILEELLSGKSGQWEDLKKDCVSVLREMAKYFSGSLALNVDKDVGLLKFFNDQADVVNKLEFRNSIEAGQQIQQLISGLDETKQFECMETSRQLSEYLVIARNSLTQMSMTANITEEMVDALQEISDLSYAWETIPHYLPLIQDRLRKDPQSVSQLRALFKKLVSILDIPLIRITQAESEDALSVAEFYSSQLLSLLRNALEVVPEQVFAILSQIVQVQSNMKRLGTKVMIEQFKELSQMQQRENLLRLTHRISLFTEGILDLQNTPLGAIEVQPQKILEDSIRRELVKKLSLLLHEVVSFPAKRKITSTSFLRALKGVSQQMAAFRSSFEYFQDFVGIYGLKIWHEELERVVGYNTERECNKFIKQKVLERNSLFQTKAVMVPKLPLDTCDYSESSTFMGRLLDIILLVTGPGSGATHLPSCGGWFDASGNEVLGLKIRGELVGSLGVTGMGYLSKLVSFRLSSLVQDFFAHCNGLSLKFSPALEELRGNLFDKDTQFNKLFMTLFKKIGRSSHIESLILQIGHLQLLRSFMNSEAHLRARSESASLQSSLVSLDQALLNIDSDFASSFAKFLHNQGNEEPHLKIYVKYKPIQHVSLILWIVLRGFLSNTSLSPNVDMVTVSKCAKCPSSMITGASTLLHHMGTEVFSEFSQLTFEFANLMSPLESQIDKRASNVADEIQQMEIITDCITAKIQ